MIFASMAITRQLTFLGRIDLVCLSNQESSRVESAVSADRGQSNSYSIYSGSADPETHRLVPKCMPETDPGVFVILN